MMRRYASLRERLLANSVEMLLKPELGPCRIWTSALNSNGYGYVNMRASNGKVRRALAHRISLAAFLGVEPRQLLNVCHECDNPPCIEPAHLRSKSQAANIKDCVERGRHNDFGRTTAERDASAEPSA